MKNKLIILVSGFLISTLANADSMYEKKPCQGFNIDSLNSCTECFDGGAIRETFGRGNLSNTFVNSTKKKLIFLEKENKNPVLFETLNKDDKWTYTKNPLFKFTQKFSAPSDKLVKKYPQLEGTSFYAFNPSESIRYIETGENEGIYLQSKNSDINTAPSSFLIKYVINYREFDGELLGELIRRESCVIYKSIKY